MRSHALTPMPISSMTASNCNWQGRVRAFFPGKKAAKKPVADAACIVEPAASRSCSDHADHRSRAGRRSRPTCAQSAQGKARKITEKQARLFYRNFPGFSDARELAWRYSSDWRKHVWFLPLVPSPAEVQEENPPGAELEAAEASNVSLLPITVLVSFLFYLLDQSGRAWYHIFMKNQ